MTSPGGRRLALLVANDNYHIPGLQPLYAPVNDATQLRELLRDPEIGGFDRTDLLVNDGKYVVELGIERMFRDAGPEDVVLLYFSGHGLRTRQNLYLATSNTDASALSSTAVSAAFIRELIRDSAAAAKIILLDCCYSGAFLGSDVVKSTAGVDDVGEQLASGEGIYVLTASSSVEIAEDGRPPVSTQAAPLSRFTEAMLLGISTGRAAFGQSWISLDDLWRFVQAEVASRTTRQTPSKYGFVRKEIYIARVRGRHGRQDRAGTASGHVPLGRLLGPLVRDPDRGLQARESDAAASMVAPIGQERRADGSAGEIVWLDLSGNDGNLVVVGRSGTGKSTLLRTLVSSLSLTHTPDEVRCYVLEDSNRLGSLSALPHVVEVAGDDQREQATAILRAMGEHIRQRKRLYRDHGIDSPGSLRRRRHLLPAAVPDLLLVIDRWHSFAGMPGFAETVRELASAGPEYGVHVATTIRDWADTPDWLAELFPTQVELRLRRPRDSRVDPALAALLPAAPGWALYEQRQFRVAMPGLADPEDDAGVVAETLGDGGAELARRVADAWRETPAGMRGEPRDGAPPPTRPRPTAPSGPSRCHPRRPRRRWTGRGARRPPVGPVGPAVPCPATAGTAPAPSLGLSPGRSRGPNPGRSRGLNPGPSRGPGRGPNPGRSRGPNPGRCRPVPRRPARTCPLAPARTSLPGSRRPGRRRPGPSPAGSRPRRRPSGTCLPGTCRTGTCRTGRCRTGRCRTGRCRTGRCRTGRCRTAACEVGRCGGALSPAGTTPPARCPSWGRTGTTCRPARCRSGPAGTGPAAPTSSGCSTST
jgi:FtsK/SpoIIIE family/Caspase domain